MVLLKLKKKTHSFFYASDPEFTQHLTCWCSTPPHCWTVFQHGSLPHPVLVLYSFSLSLSLISFTYTTRGTKTDTDSHVQLLTHAVETHKPTRKTPLSEGGRGWHLSRWQTAPFPPVSRRDDSGVSRPAADCDPAFSLLPPSAPVFLETNRIDKTKIHATKTLPHKQILEYLDITPAFTSQ